MHGSQRASYLFNGGNKMRFIRDQIKVALEAVKLEKPILKLSQNHYGIQMTLNNKPQFDSEDIANVDIFVLNAVKTNMRVKLVLDQKKYKASIDDDSVAQIIGYTIEREILDFLRLQGGFANNRLSKIYKWYKQKINEHSIIANEKLALDLYNIMKFLSGDLTEEQVKTGRILLSLIKDRYEPILGSIEA